MANRLIFRDPPVTGSPVRLVFGQPETPDSLAYASGALPLPVFTLTGGATTGAPSSAFAEGALGALPVFILAGAVAYDSATDRPLIGGIAARWQRAAAQPAATASRWQAGRRAAGRVSVRQQAAAPLSAAYRGPWVDSARVRVGARTRYQDAQGLHASALLAWEESDRLRDGARTRWQEAERLPVATVVVRHQGALHVRRGAASAWQEAERIEVSSGVPVHWGVDVRRGWRVRWQDATQPVGGKRPIVEPPEDPCYIPSTRLVFKGPAARDNRLIFICERHGPQPGTGTIVVPILEVYSVENSISLVRVNGGDIIEAKAFAMSLDADSWTWQWSATIPGAALALVQADANGDPVELVATINEVPYRLVAELPRRERSFGRSEVRVQGRGRAAVLDQPDAPVLNHFSAEGRSLAQLLALAMTVNGVGNGWDFDFQLDDWFVPGGTWAFQGKPMAAVLEIAAAAGAIVQPHPTAQTLRILPRYPAAPWHWDALTPDYALPASIVTVEGIEPVRKPGYNRVFLFGTTTGLVRGQVTRAGTAGDSIAPQVVHALMTHENAIRQRGVAELSDTGRQENVSLRLPVLPETGLILPGSLVTYDGGDAVRLGLARSIALDWSRPRLRQTITLETHPEA